jgi:hypothetical protein
MKTKIDEGRDWLVKALSEVPNEVFLSDIQLFLILSGAAAGAAYLSYKYVERLPKPAIVAVSWVIAILWTMGVFAIPIGGFNPGPSIKAVILIITTLGNLALPWAIAFFLMPWAPGFKVFITLIYITIAVVLFL